MSVRLDSDRRPNRRCPGLARPHPRVKPTDRLARDRVIAAEHELNNPARRRASNVDARRGRSTCRTAVYGPVRTVVWEGSGRKARPYPDPGASPHKH